MHAVTLLTLILAKILLIFSSHARHQSVVPWPQQVIAETLTHPKELISLDLEADLHVVIHHDEALFICC